MTKLNLAELLRDQIGNGTIEVNATITVDSIFDPYELADAEICLDTILAKRGSIAFIWCIEDVQHQRPDLSDQQAMQVLLECKRTHDANIGMNWDVIDCVAGILYDDSTEKSVQASDVECGR